MPTKLFRQKRVERQQQGFTIVELLIATVVFSVVLLVITAGILQFTNSYYRGVNTASVQATARGAMDTLAQAVQFTGQQVQTGTGAVCIGNQRYSYRLGYQLEPTVSRPDQATTALYRTTYSGGACTASFTGGQEMLNKNMRLAKFQVTSPDTKVWTITIKVAYGDIDLLCAPVSTAGSCNPGGGITSAVQAGVGDLTCKSTSGSQFCSTSALSTTVVRRIQ